MKHSKLYFSYHCEIYMAEYRGILPFDHYQCPFSKSLSHNPRRRLTYCDSYHPELMGKANTALNKTHKSGDSLHTPAYSFKTSFLPRPYQVSTGVYEFSNVKFQ